MVEDEINVPIALSAFWDKNTTDVIALYIYIYTLGYLQTKFDSKICKAELALRTTWL